MSLSHCTSHRRSVGPLLSCCPLSESNQIRERRSKKGSLALASFLPSALSSALLLHAVYLVCSSRKKEDLPRSSSLFVVDPIDPLCKFTMQNGKICSVQHPFRCNSPSSGRRCRHPTLRPTDLPSSAGLFIAAPIIRLSVLGRIFFVTRMTALQRVSLSLPARARAYHLPSLLRASTRLVVAERSRPARRR